MNYKIGISLFKDLYREAIYNTGGTAMALNPNQILLRLSLVQAELGNTYKLVEKTQQTRMVADQYEYVVGTGTDNILIDILQIQSVFTPQLTTTDIHTTRDNEPRELIKCAIEEIQSVDRYGGLPTKYAVIKQNSATVLVINSNPDAWSSTAQYNRLDINYWMKLVTFNGSGSNANSTWNDFDSAEADYGGEFKLPEDWHELIITGAVAKAVMNLDKGNSLAIWNKAVQDKLARRNLKVNPRIKYQLGFSK